MEENKALGDPDSYREKENLQVENDVLKMKMMLQHGAVFGASKDLPPEIENEFLKSVMEFENQFENVEQTLVFNKLGRPQQFRPVQEIGEEEIEDEWITLYEYMCKHGIELGV